jgi:hypothetical protein
MNHGRWAAGPARGPDAIRAYSPRWASSPRTWQVDDVISEGDKVVVRATNRCVQDSFLGVSATGVEQVFTAMFIFQFADGLVVRTWRIAADLQALSGMNERVQGDQPVGGDVGVDLVAREVGSGGKESAEQPEVVEA